MPCMKASLSSVSPGVPLAPASLARTRKIWTTACLFSFVTFGTTASAVVLTEHVLPKLGSAVATHGTGTGKSVSITVAGQDVVDEHALAPVVLKWSLMRIFATTFMS